MGGTEIHNSLRMMKQSPLDWADPDREWQLFEDYEDESDVLSTEGDHEEQDLPIVQRLNRGNRG